MKKSYFVSPFKLKNIKPTTFGLRSLAGEVAQAELVDARGIFVASGGLEGLIAKASKNKWLLENEDNARAIAAQYGGRM